MPVYRLAYSDGRRPSSVEAKEGEGPAQFLKRLCGEYRAAQQRQAEGALDHGGAPVRERNAIIDTLARPPLRSAAVRDLLRQATAMGDMAAITPAGCLDLRSLKAEEGAEELLRGAVLDGADFSFCDLSGVSLACAEARSVNFRHAVLSGCDMGGIRAVSADFRNADMRRVSLEPAVPKHWAVNKPKDTLDGKQKSDLTASRLDMADLSDANAKDVVFRDTIWTKAKTTRAAFEQCDFTAAKFWRTDAREAVFVKNQIHVDLPITEANLDTRGCRMILNSYLEIPSLLPLLTKEGWNNLKIMVSGIVETFQSGDGHGLRADAALYATSALTMAYVVQSLLSPDGGLLTTVALTSAVAGVFAFNKGSRIAVAKATDFALGNVAAAAAAFAGSSGEGLLARLRASGAALVAFGTSAKLLATALRKRPDLEPYIRISAREGTVILDTEERVRTLLHHLETVSPEGRWSTLLDPAGRLREARLFEREVGGHLPEEKAPFRVVLEPDGSATASWKDASGRMALKVHYGANGMPLRAATPAQRNLPLDEIPGQFGGRQAVFEQFKDAVVRSISRHDARTHRAQMRDDGSVVVHDRVTGRVDNPHGPAIVRPDGTVVNATQGAVSRGSASSPEAAPIPVR